MTRDYEALVILRTAGTEQEIARQAAGLEEPIKKVGGELTTSQSMGRRRLAFKIGRQAEGHYYLLRFRAPTAQVIELERIFKLNDTVVRFIILTADEVGPWQPTPSTAAPASRGAAMSSRN